MSNNLFQRSLRSLESIDFSESWLEFNKLNKDPKAFYSFVQTWEKKIKNDKSISLILPDDFKKKLQNCSINLFDSLVKNELTVDSFTEDKLSLLSFFFYAIANKVNKDEKIKEKGKILGLIKEIFIKLDNCLVLGNIEIETFRALEIILIKILITISYGSDKKSKELICKAICSLLEKIFNLHPIYVEVWSDANDSTEDSDKKSILCLALHCLNLTFPHPKCSSLSSIEKILGYFSSILERPNITIDLYANLSQGITQTLEMLKKIQDDNNKAVKALVKKNETNLTIIFEWVFYGYLEFNQEEPQRDFFHDTRPIGKLFSIVFSLIFSNLSGDNKNIQDSFEDTPVVIFNNALNSSRVIMSFYSNQANKIQLQAYVIQFLLEFYKPYGTNKLEEKKKKSVIDSGLILFLLRKCVFMVEFGNNSLLDIASLAMNNWRTIWSYLSLNKTNAKHMSKAIISSTIENYLDYSYIVKVTAWIVELESTTFIKDALKENFVGDFILSITKILKNLDNTSTELFFKLLDQLVSLKSLKEIEKNTIIESLGTKELLTNEKYSEKSFDLLKKYIQLESSNNYKIKDILKDLGLNPSLLTLLQMLLSLLETTPSFQKTLLDSSAIPILRNKLNPVLYKAFEFPVELWSLVLKCIKALLCSPYMTPKSIEEVNFNLICEYFGDPINKNYRYRINVECIEDIESILYCTRDLNSDCLIAIPQVIPFVFEILICNDDHDKLANARMRIQRQLCNEVVIMYLAYYNAFDVILKYFLTKSNLEISGFLEAVISKIIPFHLPPQSLSKLLSIIKATKNSKKKLILLQAIEQAIFNSNCPRNMLVPSHYFYFMSQSQLQFSGQAVETTLQNQISFITWINPINLNDCNLVTFGYNKSSQLSIGICNHKIKVWLEKGACESSMNLNLDKWSFICVSIRSKKVALRNKTKVSICIDQNFENTAFDEENIKFEGKFITNPVFGNNHEGDKGYNGKMSGVFLVYKSFNQTECEAIYKYSQKKNLHFSFSSLKSDDFKVLRDINKSLIFEWMPNLKEPFWSTRGSLEGQSKLTIIDTSRRFNGVNIFDSIKINGGLKIFLPLIDLENPVQDEILVITSIFLKIFINNQSHEILSEDFIQLSGYVLNTIPFFPSLTSNLIKIIKSLSDKDIRKKLLQFLLVNDSIDHISASEKTKHLNSIMPFMKDLFECNKENLVTICSLIKGLNPDDIFRILNNFIPEVLDSEQIEAICLIIVQMNKDESIIELDVLLSIISERIPIVEGDLQAAMIFMVTDKHSLSLQKKILEILLKNIEKVSEKKKLEQGYEIDKFKNIIYCLNQYLPDHIDHSVVTSLSELIFIDHIPEVLKIMLLDVIANRISYASCSDDLLFYLTLVEQNSSKLVVYLNKSSYFPHWLIKTFNNNRNRVDLVSLCNALFVPPVELICLSKLRSFIMSINDQLFIRKLLYKLCEDYCKLKIFSNIEDFIEFGTIINETNRDNYREIEYFKIISQMCEFGIEHNMFTINHNYLDLSFHRVKPSIKDSKELCLVKLILKLLMKGMKHSNSDFKSILSKVIPIFLSLSTQRSEKKLYFDDMIVLEIFTKLCEIYYYTNGTQWLEHFIDAYSIINRLKNLIDIQFEQEIKKTLEDWENILSQSKSINYIKNTEAINNSISFLSESSSRSMSGDSSNIKDSLKKIIRDADKFPSILKKHSWIINIHSFLYNYFVYSKKTGKKVRENYIYNEECYLDNTFLEFSTNIMQIIKKYDCDWIKNFKKTKRLVRLHIEKRYKAYLHTLSTLKNILTLNVQKEYKIRPYADNEKRFPLLTHCKTTNKNISRLNLTRSPDKMLIRSFSIAYFESIIEKSGEMYSPLFEEPENSEIELPANQEGSDTTSDTIASSKIIECERITIKGTYFGNLEINGNYLVYISEGKKKPEGEKYLFSALEFTQLKKECRRIWEANEISEIICRRFMHQHTALEVFLKSGKSYYFNVFDNSIREQLFDSLKKWKSVLVISKITSKIVKFYTKKWLDNKLDNFGYLLALNKLASRSFHDLSQYPVFPWVIKDFTSESLDMKDPGIYRDFKWPIGAQDEEHRKEIIKKYTQFQEEDMPAFNYGSHYSSGGVVLHYLVRIQPYSHQAKMLHNDSFDVADRLFISMENCWKSCTGYNGDVKELIPEMFYFTEALYNINKCDFGTRQNGKAVDDFEPPPWAKNNRDFIRKHRKCLESPIVTEELHNWIDLVFGYKQTGREAVDNLNIFFSVSYEENFLKACSEDADPMTRQGIIEQAYHFGQTPARIILKPHIQKKAEKLKKTSIFETFFTKPREEEKKGKIDSTGRKINTNDQEIKSSIKVELPGRVFALMPTYEYLLALKWDLETFKYYLIRIKWSNTIEFGQNYKSSELEGYCIIQADNWLEHQSWKSTLPKQIDIKMIFDIGQNQFCIWEDKYIVSAFHSDYTFKLNTIKGDLKKSVNYHCGLVTCVFATESYLFSGSIDSSVASWTGEDVEMHKIYLGHTSSIRQIQASDTYLVVLSLSSNGTILMHDIRSADCLRKFTDPDVRPATVMAISELGVVAVAFMDKEYTEIFTLNGMHWDDSRPGAEVVWVMVFNKTGEYLVTGSNKSIAFFDVFDNGNGLDNLMHHNTDNTVLAIAISKDEDFLVHAINKSDKAIINLLKIQSRFESQMAMDIIKHFA